MSTGFDRLHGRMLEEAWASYTGGRVVGGLGDGGADVGEVPNHTGFFQVKSSVDGAMSHLAVGMKRGLIPVVVGEPDRKIPCSVVLKALVTHGVWVNPQVPVKGNLGAVVTHVIHVGGRARTALRQEP